MTTLAFEQIDDVRAPHPYLFVYVIEEGGTFQVGRGHPFLQIAVEKDLKLNFNFYPTENEVSLNVEQWEKILQVARDFLQETIESGDDW